MQYRDELKDLEELINLITGLKRGVITKRKFITECNNRHIGAWWKLKDTDIAKALKHAS